MVKLFFLVEHETDLDGQFVDVLAHFFADVLHVLQPHGIFLGRDDHLRAWHGGKHLIDVPNILSLELMMV